MAYWLGDIPAEDIVIEPVRNGEPIDLTPFESTAEVVVTAPDGTTVHSTAGFLATVDDAQIVVEWPTDTPLDQAGVWRVVVTLVTADDQREQAAPVYLVVQTDDGWYTLDGAREDWEDAPSSDGRLHQLLGLAREQVTAYAPVLADAAAVPERYKAGQLMQARNLWNSGQVDPTGGIGEDSSFTLHAFPLDWMVRQILRPKTAIPKVR